MVQVQGMRAGKSRREFLQHVKRQFYSSTAEFTTGEILVLCSRAGIVERLGPVMVLERLAKCSDRSLELTVETELAR
jgi:hypothetical protein